VDEVTTDLGSQPAEDDAEVETGPPETTEPDGAVDHRPPKLAWLVLGVLALGAIGFALLHDNDALMADDFSTPKALQTWPDDGYTYRYVDGEYHVATTGASGAEVFAYHELPRGVDGLELTVTVRPVAGQSIPVIDCVSAATKDEQTNSATVTDGYSFAFAPSNDSYAIIHGNDLVDHGTLSLGSVVTVGCASDGANTTLSVSSDGSTPINVQQPGGRSFVGIGLGLLSSRKSGPAEVAFDDLRVTKA
jgi:hypothetical protein